MSQATGSENKENPALSSAESGKVLQNPQPCATSRLANSFAVLALIHIVTVILMGYF
jgi:hypothetical protein